MIAGLCLGLLCACGELKNETAAPGHSTACAPGTAVIGAMDGLYQPYCGCLEAEASQPVAATVTCTIAAPAYIQFLFSTFITPAQIVPEPGNPTDEFRSSPVIDLKKLPNVRAHGFEIRTPGTYSFREAFRPGMTGQLVIQ